MLISVLFYYIEYISKINSFQNMMVLLSSSALLHTNMAIYWVHVDFLSLAGAKKEMLY
jgi:hypothetical protein